MKRQNNKRKRKKNKCKKEYTYKRNVVKKCVKMETFPVSDDAFKVLDDTFETYRKCKDMFLKRLGGIGNIMNVQSFYDIRNTIRAEQKRIEKELKQHGNKTYCEIYGTQTGIWVMALFDACMLLKSMWTNTGNLCKSKLRDNNTKLTKEERAYCNYVLSAPEILYCVLNDIPYEKNPSKTYMNIINNISYFDKKRMNYVHSVLKRLIRKNKPTLSALNANCMLLDEIRYKIISEDDADYIYFMTNQPKTRLKLKLKGRFCYRRKGNIQLIFNRKKRNVAIHKCINIKQRQAVKNQTIGIDKGYSTLISCNNGNGKTPEYGEDFGKLISAETERINKAKINKKYFYKKRTKILKNLKSTTDNNNKRILKEALKKLERNNLGKTKHDKQHLKVVKHMETNMNYSIKKCLREMEPSEIVLEDLTFTFSGKKKKGKSFNRKMASWQKGVLDKRIVYIGKLFGAETEHVNAAYTSQYCNVCGSKLGKRYGAHNEYADCEICGKVNANTNAAGNILDRKTDKKIMQYTPYKMVKEICEERAASLNAAIETSSMW